MKKPIQYITGTQGFWNFDHLIVNESVLIPRPDTERLVEVVLEKFPVDTLNVLELGTGSGAIALALASEKPNWNIDAVDVSHEALNVAKQNAQKYKISSVNLFESDWFSNIKSTYDLIISNPPYVAENDPHLSDLICEPQLALVSGKQGLNDLAFIIANAKHYLNSEGALVLEHGYDQGASVRELMRAAKYSDVETFKDYGRNERVSVCRVVAPLPDPLPEGEGTCSEKTS